MAMIAIAGSFGALARYQLSAIIQRRTQSSVPFGTAVVNLVGAFGLGLVLGSDPNPTGPLLMAAGFTGGFTTFSTWMIETARLGILPKLTTRATLNLTVLALFGVACAALGYHLTS